MVGVTVVTRGCAEFRCLSRVQGVKPQRSLEAIMFTSEEPTRFGISCIGRCAIAYLRP